MNKGFDGEPSVSGALAPEVHLAGQAVRFTPTICPQGRNSIPTSPPRPPNGYHTAPPYLTVTGADQLIVFLTQVVGARETERVTRPDGKIAHADARVGDSVIMLAEASTDWPPMPGAIYLYVHNTDTTYQAALQSGGASLMEPADQFHGDRMAGVRDPFGNVW